VLRDWSPADGQWYVSQLGDPDIQRFTSEQPTTTADDFRAALARLGGRRDHAGFAIVKAATGRLAGNIAADLTADGDAEVNYWVAPGFRGRALPTGPSAMSGRRSARSNGPRAGLSGARRTGAQAKGTGGNASVPNRYAIPRRAAWHTCAAGAGSQRTGRTAGRRYGPSGA
jgi:hypothetical protein